MRLVDYILRDLKLILQRWETFATTLVPAVEHLSSLSLLDHGPQILQAIVADLAGPQTPAEESTLSMGRAPVAADAPHTAAQTHAVLRAESGFNIEQLVSEYRALRASVLRGWMDACLPDPPHADDMIRFNEAIDRALAESIVNFMSHVNRAHEQIDAELRASEERLRLALEAAATGLWTWDVATQAVTWSKEAYAIHGLMPCEFGGTEAACFRLVHPDDVERVRATVRAAVDGHTRYESEFRIVRPDNDLRWVTNLGRATYDDQGQPLFVTGTVTDITARKRVEAELQASQQQLAALLDATTAVVYQYDTDSRLVLANRQCRDLFGNGSDMRGRSLYEFFPADIAADFEAGNRRVLAEGRAMEFEEVAPHSDGLHYYATVKAPLIVDGVPLGVVGVSTDISDWKRAQEQLREAERRFHTLADAAPVLIWQTDESGAVVFVNRYYLEFLGVPFEAVAGLGWADFLHPDDRAVYVDAFRSACAQQVGYESQCRFRRHDGEYRWLHNVGRPQLGPNGYQQGVIGCSFDITDSKRAEGVLVELDRNKNNFLATLAHELRTPLSALYAGLQVLQRAGGDAAMSKKAVALIQGQSWQMTQIINDLMDVGRIGQGKINLQKTRMNMADAVHSAVDACCALIDSQEHELTVDSPDQATDVEGDCTRLTQVLVNLLNNAAKFTPKGGRIRLALKRQGNDVVVSVTDNGSGIPAPMLDKVFDMYAQADRSLEKAQGGLGIGLSLVKQLVELHGGSVIAASDGCGMGSTFTVRLPAAPSTTAICPTRRHSMPQLQLSARVRESATTDHCEHRKH